MNSRAHTAWMALVVSVLAGCRGGASAGPSVASPEPEPTGRRAAPWGRDPERRCLAVVAAECGCVYACGIGELDGARWRVKHAFWPNSILDADIRRWCGDASDPASCTDVFAADIVCDGICTPRAADATCRLARDGSCSGAEAAGGTP